MSAQRSCALSLPWDTAAASSATAAAQLPSAPRLIAMCEPPLCAEPIVVDCSDSYDGYEEGSAVRET